jgi:hypothetical protein
MATGAKVDDLELFSLVYVESGKAIGCIWEDFLHSNDLGLWVLGSWQWRPSDNAPRSYFVLSLEGIKRVRDRRVLARSLSSFLVGCLMLFRAIL